MRYRAGSQILFLSKIDFCRIFLHMWGKYSKMSSIEVVLWKMV
ncbi:MAG: hypothetical protein K0R22_2666 [Sporomusa sp.]|jgi:hypothetical protein|nr:hypothetical protein [Sporomusa sp.]